MVGIYGHHVITMQVTKNIIGIGYLMCVQEMLFYIVPEALLMQLVSQGELTIIVSSQRSFALKNCGKETDVKLIAITKCLSVHLI